MLNWGLERTLFNVEHFRNMNEELNVFPSIHENLKSILPDFDENGDDGEFVMSILGDVFDENWLEEQFFVALEDILSYTKGEKESLTVEIDLADRKEFLEDRIAEELVLEEGFSSGEAEAIAEGMEEEVELPDKLYLEDLLEEEETRNIFSYIIMIRTYSPIVSYAVLGLFLILMFLLAGFIGGFKWFGFNLLFSGTLFLSSLILLNTFLDLEFMASFFEIPKELEFVLSLIRYTLEKIVFIPVVYCLSGLFFILLGFILGMLKKRKDLK